MPTTSVRRRTSRFSRSCGLLDQTCRQTSRGKAVKASRSPSGGGQVLGRGGELGLERLDDAGELGADLVGVGLVEDRAQQRQHHGWAPLGTLVARLRA
jgi:hypothetical protein